MAATLLALPGVGWTVLFFLAPMALLFVYSFGSVNLLTLHVQFGWTLSNYTQIGQKLYLQPIVRSLRAVGGGHAGVPADRLPGRVHDRAGARPASGAAAARRDDPVLDELRRAHLRDLRRDRRQRADLLDRCTASGIVHGYIHVLFTQYGVGIGIVYTYLPLMILPLFVSLERIDPALHGGGRRPRREPRRGRCAG